MKSKEPDQEKMNEFQKSEMRGFRGVGVRMT